MREENLEHVLHELTPNKPRDLGELTFKLHCQPKSHENLQGAFPYLYSHNNGRKKLKPIEYEVKSAF